MADGKHWAKLWYSALSDDNLLALPPGDRWAWAALMAYTRMHGNKGIVVIHPQNGFLATAFGCSPADVLQTIKRLPNIIVEENAKGVTPEIALHFKNWNKYNKDNSLERVRRWRAQRAVTVSLALHDNEKGGPQTVQNRELATCNDFLALQGGNERKGGSPKKEIPPHTPLLEKITPPLKEKPPPPPPSFQIFGEGDLHPRRRPKTDGTKPADVFDPSWAKEPWPSVRCLVALYNAEAPDEWPSVERVSDDTRAKKIHKYLTKFPTLEFWQTVFANAKKSRFLRSYKNAGLDWLLQAGKNDGVENALKVFEGKYDD